MRYYRSKKECAICTMKCVKLKVTIMNKGNQRFHVYKILENVYSSVVTESVIRQLLQNRR